MDDLTNIVEDVECLPFTDCAPVHGGVPGRPHVVWRLGEIKGEQAPALSGEDQGS